MYADKPQPDGFDEWLSKVAKTYLDDPCFLCRTAYIAGQESRQAEIDGFDEWVNRLKEQLTALKQHKKGE